MRTLASVSRRIGDAVRAGVLIAVPVMLSVVRIVNGTKGWYEAGVGVKRGA